jgi:hypothetical protein
MPQDYILCKKPILIEVDYALLPPSPSCVIIFPHTPCIDTDFFNSKPMFQLMNIGEKHSVIFITSLKMPNTRNDTEDNDIVCLNITDFTVFEKVLIFSLPSKRL